MPDSVLDKNLEMIGKQSASISESQPITHLVFLILAALVLVSIAGAIVYMIYKRAGQDKFSGFLFEVSADGKSGKASVSRLQMLIWNFVVAFAFLYVLATRPNILAATKALFQPEILVLLGISNATYLLGKRTKQGSAKPEPGSSENEADRGGQPATPGDQAPIGPGPQGTQ